MKKIAHLKSRLIKRIFGLLSFTTALFVFQACYGTPQDLQYIVEIEGNVKSKATNMPVPGIEVSSGNGFQIEITDEEGKFYTSGHLNDDDLTVDPVTFKFKDIDGAENGCFAEKDTTFTPEYVQEPIIFEVLLDEVQ